jgi:hypothetical protein
MNHGTHFGFRISFVLHLNLCVSVLGRRVTVTTAINAHFLFYFFILFIGALVGFQLWSAPTFWGLNTFVFVVFTANAWFPFLYKDEFHCLLRLSPL